MARALSILLFTLLAVRAFPRILLLVPFFLLARAAELYDTHILIILIIVAFNQPFAIWLMRGFFLDVPRELPEAAMIDGCSSLGAFVRVVLPVVRPGVFTAALFTFLFAVSVGPWIIAAIAGLLADRSSSSSTSRSIRACPIPGS